MRSASLVVGLVFAAATQAATERSWSVYPGFLQPGIAGMEVVDLDGDGQAELVVAGSRFERAPARGGEFIAILAPRNGELDIVDMYRLRPDESIEGRFHLLAGPAPRRLAMQVTRDEQHSYVMVLEGKSLAPVSQVAIPANFSLAGIADVDADGHLEVFGRDYYNGGSAGQPVVLDGATGTVEWTGTGLVAWQMAADQLDADAALELVIGGEDEFAPAPSPGVVVDGATHATQWTYPDGFRGRIVPGAFDGVAATREFATAAHWGTLRLFATAPFFSPISEHAAEGARSALAYDIDGNGVDELVVGEGGVGSIRAFSTATWTAVFNHEHDFFATSALAVGQLDGDPAPELAYGAGTDTTGPDVLRVLDMQTGNLAFSRVDSEGPYSSVRVGDLDDDGVEEVVWITPEYGLGGRNVRLTVSSAVDGTELRHVDAVANNAGDPSPTFLEIANLDGDASLEIVVAGRRQFGLELRVLDGATLQTQWERSAFNDSPAGGVAIAPLDGDGIHDIIVLSGGRLIAFGGADGAELWRTPGITRQLPQSLALGQTDADPQPEALLGNGSALYVIDTQTRLFERSLDHGAPILGASTEGVDAACRIVVHESARLVRRRCDDASVDSTRPFGITAKFVKKVGDSHEPLVLSDGFRAFLFEGFRITEAGETLGPELGAGNLGTLAPGPDGIALYTGDARGVYRIVLRKDVLMRDGFE